MLRDRFDSPGEREPAALRAEYDELLARTIEAVGPDDVARESGVERARLTAILEGETPSLTLSEAAAVLATDDELPDAEAIQAEARDILLLGMSTAVLDVDRLASGIDDQLTPKEIQQKAEGRHPIDLDEYALLHSYIASQQ
jgi:hypothetical protein